MRIIPHVVIVLFVVRAASAIDGGWKADPAFVRQQNEKRPGVIYDEAKVPKYELPDPLVCKDGTKVTSSEQWTSKRRAELMELFRANEYGRSPGKPQEMSFKTIAEDPKALDGAATMRRIGAHLANDGKTLDFQFVLYVPNKSREAHQPSPALMLIDHRRTAATHPAMETGTFWPADEIVKRGYATVAFGAWDLAPDDPQHFREGVMRLFGDTAATTRPGDAWGGLAAWGWGASRVLDYLETDKDIDAKKVALVGHSRGGKCAIWACAEDERFAICYPNASGCGGAAIARRKYGETLFAINERFFYWFCENFKQFSNRENELPFDQHEAVALIAPRPIYLAGGTEDLWVDPRGGFESLAASSSVYALFGQPVIKSDQMPGAGEQLIVGNRGFHMHAGRHDLGVFDWQKFMDFADRVWKH